MIIQRAYKTELKPNNKQRTNLLRHTGCSRFAFNWGLSRVKEKTSKPNAMELHRELNSQKKTEFPWMYEVSKCAMQESLRDLDKAFKHFFRRCKQKGQKPGFPKFKSKAKGIGSFRLTGTIRIENNRIKLPRLGWIRLKEYGYIPKDQHILSATVSEKAGRWFVSVLVSEETQPQETSGTIGIDLGIKTLTTCSDNTSYDNPKALKQYENKIKRLQRHMMKRQTKGSNRRKQTQRKIAKLWMKIANIRKDAIHKATSEIVKTKRPALIVLEDLNIKGMVKNHCLAKSVHDASMRQFRTVLEYKQNWAGGRVEYADRFYPSSKTCSECGCVRDKLTLDERVFKCYSCGVEKDRDFNAALNLSRYTASSVGICEAVASLNGQGDAKVAASNEAVGVEEMTIKQGVNGASSFYLAPRFP